jgi:hypothetical protein
VQRPRCSRPEPAVGAPAPRRRRSWRDSAPRAPYTAERAPGHSPATTPARPAFTSPRGPAGQPASRARRLLNQAGGTGAGDFSPPAPVRNPRSAPRRRCRAQRAPAGTGIGARRRTGGRLFRPGRGGRTLRLWRLRRSRPIPTQGDVSSLAFWATRLSAGRVPASLRRLAVTSRLVQGPTVGSGSVSLHTGGTLRTPNGHRARPAGPRTWPEVPARHQTRTDVPVAGPGPWFSLHRWRCWHRGGPGFPGRGTDRGRRPVLAGRRCGRQPGRSTASP